MARTSRQKLKILYIMQMLLESTDEEHALSANDIIAKLSLRGISAERKSVYADIEMLKLYGLDILSGRGEPRGYYIASRDFEMAELKLLVDAVQSSKFITEKKSGELIKKLEGLCSRHEATKLQRQVVVSNRVKTMNESIYYNIDKIHTAISGGVNIRCKYCEWTKRRRLEPKRGGEIYEISPWVLTWDNENYYLIAFDCGAGSIRHYRVDKMMDIEITSKPRVGSEEFKDFDIAKFTKKTFGMFAGEETEVLLRCEDSLIGVIMDRFGKDTHISPSEDGFFTVRVQVDISAQFYGWLCGLGSGVRLIGPEEEVRRYAEYIHKIADNYAKQ